MANLLFVLHVTDNFGEVCAPTTYTKVEDCVEEFANFAWPNQDMTWLEAQICGDILSGSIGTLETDTFNGLNVKIVVSKVLEDSIV